LTGPRGTPYPGASALERRALGPLDAAQTIDHSET
jgi:hypothetical protein